MKTFALLWLALNLTACAKANTRCDAHLEAINGPRPGTAAIDRSATLPAHSLAGTEP
jgi:hypothetical protein